MRWWVIISVVAGTLAGSLTRSGAGLPPREDRWLSDDYTIRHWRQVDGLPSDRVSCLARTRDGYLWAGTFGGLVRFDGLRFVRFDHSTVGLLADHRIHRLAEDGAGNLWVATESHEALVFGPQGWVMPRFHGNPLSPDLHLHSDGGGGILVATTAGWLRSVNPEATGMETGTHGFRLERAVEIPGGTADVLEALGVRFRVTENELFVEGEGVPGHRRFPLPRGEVPNRNVATLTRTDDGAVWLVHGEFNNARPFRLYRTAHPEGELGLVDDELPSPGHQPLFLTPGADGSVWHAAGSGTLGRATPTTRVRYRFPSGYERDAPLDVVAGTDGSLWVALENSGLMHLRPRRLHGVRREDGLPHEMVRAVVAAASGELLVGTDDGVAQVEAGGHPGEWRAIGQGLTGSSVRALAWDAQGTLWAGTARGLFSRNRGEWRAQPLPRVVNGADGQGLGSIKVRDLLALRGGGLWVVTAQQVAVIPRDGTPAWTLASLPTLGPTDLLEDRAGNIWLATERAGVVVMGAGVHRLGPEQAAVDVPGFPEDHWRLVPQGWLRASQGLASDHAWELLEDREGTVWIASARGLLRLSAAAARAIAAGATIPTDPGSAPFLFTPRHGLPELTINTLVEDGQGGVWLGGDHGVSRILLREFREVAEGAKRNLLRSEVFSVADGLPAEETNGRISHAGSVRDGEGRVWFGTTAGLACFPPMASVPAGSGPRAAIEEVRIDGRVWATTMPMEPEGGTILPDDRRGAASTTVRRLPERLSIGPGGGSVLEIRFTGLDDAAPRDLRFRYQLEGYEDVAHEVGDRRVAYFTHLSPGTYRFRVWASGRAGVWSASPSEFGFTLAPFVWQTWWFRLLGGLAVLGLATAAVGYRIRQVRRIKDLRWRAEQADLRSRLARDLHDGLGSGLARLALLSHAPVDGDLPPHRVARQFEELSKAVRELAQTVREISWNAHPSPISLESLMAQIAQQAGEFLGAAGIRCRTSLPVEFPSRQLTPEQRANLYFAAKEAVTNVVRHAAASEARLVVEIRDDHLVLGLWDNGKGLGQSSRVTTAPVPGVEPGPMQGGNGLPNLRARVAALGGKLCIESPPEGGTTVRFVVGLGNLESPTAERGPAPRL